MGKFFLKNTKSLCHICLEETDARIFLQENAVIIEKECKEHGLSSSVVDPNGDLYLRAVSGKNQKYHPYGLVLPITTRCNLKCKWCYLPDRNYELSIDEIKEIIDTCPHRFIVFSGGEPTLRSDLAGMISYVRQHHPDKFTVLLTNGVKLAEYGYVSELKAAGLQYVILSLNGFREETHEYISNKSLADLKKQALRNLEKLRIWTILSMTLAKGVNEDEFVKIYRYGIRNLHFIRQIRLRNVSEIGVYKEGEHIYLSDMLGLVSKATDFSVEEMIQNNSRANAVFKTGNYFVFDIFKALKKRLYRRPWGKLKFWFKVINLTGASNALRLFTERSCPKETRLMFRIEIFSWPTASNIDLCECRLFCIDHMTNDKEILPFWEALYRNDRVRRSSQKEGLCLLSKS